MMTEIFGMDGVKSKNSQRILCDSYVRGQFIHIFYRNLAWIRLKGMYLQEK
jgi:hypothetical protein